MFETPRYNPCNNLFYDVHGFVTAGQLFDYVIIHGALGN